MDAAGGGGTSVSNASTVENNIVEGNRQGLVQGDYTGGVGGGGISVQSMGGATVVGNQVLNNTWNGYPDGMYGSGIDVLVADNVIRGNHEPAGPPPDHSVDPTNVSGLAVTGDDIAVVDNVIDGNAGDMAVNLGGGDAGGIAFIGNTVVNNAGIGLATWGTTHDVQVVDSVIAPGPGLPAIACDMRWDTTPPGFSHDNVYGTDGSTAADEKTLSHACAYKAGANGNLSVAPDFSAAATYVPAQGSPLVDAGIDVLTGATTDIAGQPRIFDGDGDGMATLDIGAYERQ